MNIRPEPHPLDVSPSFDTSGCAQEPIHIPGAIQPHGALLAVLVDSGLVTHASANLSAILGRSAEAVLGQPLELAIGEVACQALQDEEFHNAFVLFRRLCVLRGPGGEALHLRAFRSDRHLCIDIEPTHEDVTHGQHVSLQQSIMETFEHATDPLKLCQLAVKGLKAITSYDRVIAYRFAEDGHGEVIAESCESYLDPFIGLHYPAADMPPQARQQLLRQRVGTIVDCSYQPVLLLEDPALDDHAPLDLTHSALRSVSPVHREYMRNMNIAASMTVGLALGQKLWGMLVCHHATPRAPDHKLRAVADTTGRVVSLLLGSLGEREALAARLRGRSTLRALAERLAVLVPLVDAFAAAETELLDLVGATGAVLRLSGKVFCLGRTPSPPEAERALALLQPEACGELLAVDDLSLRYPDLAGCASEGSGALLLPLTGSADDAILWFRPELVRTIVWGGNPAEHATFDLATGRRSPRASFAAWREIVTGHSPPWMEADLALARELRSTIATEVAARTKAELFELRHYDPLTGLPNRTLLQKRLLEPEKTTDQAVNLLFISLEETKLVNEALGYAAGDELLIEAARRLVVAAGQETFLARLGGAEFVVLSRGLQPDAATELGEEIRRAIEAPFKIYGSSFHISCGIGISLLDQSRMLDPPSAAALALQDAIIMIGAKQRAGAQRLKMEKLGQMMGGVAHEINNMLQPAALLIQDVIDQELVVGDAKQHLGIVLDCNRKARQIIRDMLAFSRPMTPSTEIHDPVVLLRDSLPIVRHAVPPGVVISTRIEGCLPLVKINRTTFVQILLNLAINAAAAMNGQGELAIALEEDAHGRGDGEMGQQISLVRLHVIDRGCGMDKATLDRVFEPFFTTKPVGQGTGLGLSVVHGLVRDMGATIELASELGCGTTVTILIPGHNGEFENGSHTGS